VLKELTPGAGQATADFSFAVTNISSSQVVIDGVRTSCGCTVAKLPSQPWLLAPHDGGQIHVTVNLAGKSGTIYKTITVLSTNAPKVLTVKVNLPENPVMVRARNAQMAAADRQAVFKNDCAKCHAEPAKDKTGKDLYVAVCAICHEEQSRNPVVPDLHRLNKPTDYAYWKEWITNGKANSMMPAFAKQQGGPLTDEQIDSLAQVLVKALPPGVQAVPRAKPVPPEPPIPILNKRDPGQLK